jgi:hypothetical protein
LHWALAAEELGNALTLDQQWLVRDYHQAQRNASRLHIDRNVLWPDTYPVVKGKNPALLAKRCNPQVTLTELVRDDELCKG